MLIRNIFFLDKVLLERVSKRTNKTYYSTDVK